MKKIISLLLILLCLGSLIACREDNEPVNEEPEKINSLIGTWKEITDDEKDHTWYEIVVESDSISIYELSWYTTTKTLKWKGNYSDPQEPFTELTFNSTQIEGSTTRTFKYADEILSVDKTYDEADYEYKPTIRCKKLEEETT